MDGHLDGDEPSVEGVHHAPGGVGGQCLHVGVVP